MITTGGEQATSYEVWHRCSVPIFGLAPIAGNTALAQRLTSRRRRPYAFADYRFGRLADRAPACASARSGMTVVI